MIAIRPMTTGDWPAVAAIYAEGLATGAATFETGVPSWRQWDEEHRAAPRLVAHDRAPAGWLAVSDVSARPCYSGVVEHSVYVAGAARGRGTGRALLEALIATAPEHGIWTIQTAIMASTSRASPCTAAAASGWSVAASGSQSETVSGTTRSCWSSGCRRASLGHRNRSV